MWCDHGVFVGDLKDNEICGISGDRGVVSTEYVEGGGGYGIEELLDEGGVLRLRCILFEADDVSDVLVLVVGGGVAVAVVVVVVVDGRACLQISRFLCVCG